MLPRGEVMIAPTLDQPSFLIEVLKPESWRRNGPLTFRGGTVSGNPAGPEGMIPSVPTPVTKPRSERLAKLLVGLLVVVAVRK